MKKFDLSELKNLSLAKKGLLVVQGVNGVGFLVMAFITLFKLGFTLDSLVLTALLAAFAALGFLGSYFFLKGERKGYGFSMLFQLLLLFSFSCGDYVYEMNPPISLDLWATFGQTKFGVDVLALTFLIMIFKWLMSQKRS